MTQPLGPVGTITTRLQQVLGVGVALPSPQLASGHCRLELSQLWEHESAVDDTVTMDRYPSGWHPRRGRWPWTLLTHQLAMSRRTQR
jgi:hypothetical protein